MFIFELYSRYIWDGLCILVRINRIYIRNKFDRNPLHCKLPIDCIQNNDHERIQMIKELIDVKEGKSYVPFFHINDLETTFDYLCTY